MVKLNVSYKWAVFINSIITLWVLNIILNGCVDKRSRKELFVKKKVCNQLWREKYLVFSGGAYSAELYSDYITDSINFRVYIGSHDEYSSFEYQCLGDSVIISKFSHDYKKGKELIDQSILRLSELVKAHKFE